MRKDHSSLLWLRSFKEPEAQVACWLEQLEEYDFETIHQQGKLHGNADALSYLPQTDGKCDISSNSVMSAVATTAFIPAYSFSIYGPSSCKMILWDPF